MSSPNTSAENEIVQEFRVLEHEQKIELLTTLLNRIKTINRNAEINLLTHRELMIPLSIFSQDALSSLEAIVKYSREVQGLRFSKILRRNNKTI